MLDTIKLWFIQVSRGYTAPMSLLNWFVVFVIAMKEGGNATYGFLALIGIVCAHLGTNVFDDYIDQILKTPKQAYKSTHLDNGSVTLKQILKLAIIYFSVASIIGLFLTFKCGLPVILLAFIGGLIVLAYPKLNNFALGELAVGIAFGPLLFIGTYFVMLKEFSIRVALISIPIAILTVVLLVAHALMDFDFDIKSGKKNFCTVLGSKQNALIGLFSLIILAYFLTVALIIIKILPVSALATCLTIPLCLKLYKAMKAYISTDKHHELAFIKNFAVARNIDVFYCIIVSLCIMLG